jgi:membrane associated rhomboid family serine protease
VYTAVLILLFVLQGAYPLAEAGRVDAVAICADAEVWRAVTALTLHADVVHLVSNLVAGAGFAFFVARFFGAAAGWLLILIAGTLGNLLNALVHYPEPHYSIGASTAVFAALGLLTGVGLRHALVGPGEGWTLPRWLLPVFGGLTLLGMLGVGEGPVDVAAHISGFLCGGALGLLAALRQGFFRRLERLRLGLGCGALVVVGLAWLVAMGG